MGDPARAIDPLYRSETAAILVGRLDEALAAANDGLARSRQSGNRGGEARGLAALCDAYS